NVVGALNLLDAMRAAGVPRLVFSSTAATYGEPPVELITEDTPNAPVNAYGNSKLTIDRMLADEARAHGLAAVSLRYFNVAGASGPLGEDHTPETHLIPLILQAAAGKRDSVAIFGTDYPTPPPCATTSTSTTSPARTCSRSRRPCPDATTSTTSAASAAIRCARSSR